MASFRAAALALMGGMVATAALTGTLVSGCSGGDNNSSDSGTMEGGGVDATYDVAAETGHEGGGADVVGTDTGGDTGNRDGGGADGDATVDGDAARPDAGDSGTPIDAARDGDAATDAPPVDAGPNALQIYALHHAQAFCTQLLECCTGFAGYDSGPAGIDFATCVGQQQTQGFENTLPNDPRAYTRGHLTLNAEAGAGCLTALPSFPCGGMITAAQNAAVANACYGVFTGTIPSGGGGCISSFECAAGSYCNMLLDGGAIPNGDAAALPSGVCSAIGTTGTACSLLDPKLGISTSEQCNTATAQPTHYCTASITLEAGTCQPLLGDDAGCADPTGVIYDLACTAELCAGGPNGQNCGGTFTNDSNNLACTAFPTDAGGGG